MSNVTLAQNEGKNLNSTFEGEVLKAKNTNEFMPVWELFINTKFFVMVIPNDTGEQTQDFRFSIFQSKDTQKRASCYYNLRI